MSENKKSIMGWQRSCRCAEIGEEQLGQELCLMGWCHRQRNLGGMIFIGLRDRSGELQLVVGDQAGEELKQLAAKVRQEYVLAVRGRLALRQDPNPKMPTGRYELLLSELRILSEAETPPFYIEDGVEANEALRLKYRYLDLRRPEMQRLQILRHQIVALTHSYFDAQGFLEIETPMLGKSTPEGARDYLVPSRVKPGCFFALPQSPQLYKQLLMVAGMDRYIQLARCFRDEDLRADRQPEFTQIDLEMSFVNEEDVMSVVEGYVLDALELVRSRRLPSPVQRLTYAEAMRRFGSDKPDLRFDLELQDFSSYFQDTEFPVFKAAMEAGGRVLGLVVPGGGSMSRKQLDSLATYIKTYRVGTLAWLVAGETWRGSILKFVSEERQKELREAFGLNEGDLLLLAADSQVPLLQNGLGQLRCELARRLGLLEGKEDSLLWVTEFPLFEYDEEEQRFVAKHHPFTMPMEEDIPKLDSQPEAVRAKAYDIVLNGVELGGGSIRIFDQELQERMFGLLGFSKEQAWAQFGFLLEAFRYGVPPHGGCALGLDRLIMLLAGTESIREVIAFPKVQSSADLMTEAPSTVSPKQLDELQIRTVEVAEE